ncbi:hypothetical protein NOF04DRAFT_1330823, partial [Fusarium oxysporum II5]
MDLGDSSLTSSLLLFTYVLEFILSACNSLYSCLTSLNRNKPSPVSPLATIGSPATVVARPRESWLTASMFVFKFDAIGFGVLRGVT